jgi:glycosyltransferase involved in cell wall biosynthesis
MSGRKILHFIESGGLYGAESVIINLSQQMLKSELIPVIGSIVQKKDQKVELIDCASASNITSQKLVINNKRIILDIFIVARYLKKSNIRLIHSHGYKPSVFGFIISLLTGIPIISTCHLWFTDGTPFKQKFMIRLELLCYRFFPHIIAVSEPIKKVLVQSKINKNKISVVENGVDLGRITSKGNLSREQLRDRLGIPRNSFVMLNVGRLSKQKAQSNIISSIKTLVGNGKEVYCLIAGDGELRSSLEQQILESKLEKNIRLLGFQSEINWLFVASDIFVLPSIDEGMPISLLEAVAFKKPVIVTPVGDIPKIIEDRRSGKVVQVNDVPDLINAIEWMMSNEDQRMGMAEEALINITLKYSSNAMAKSYISIYESILN